MSAPWGDAKSWETADDRCNSDLDTAAIRDRYRGRSIRTDGRLTTDAEHVIALCDALDEVRREATYFSGRTEDLRIDFQAMRSRAESAELQAQLNGREVYGLYMKERERAEKAEAQVAAVRAALDAQPE